MTLATRSGGDEEPRTDTAPNARTIRDKIANHLYLIDNGHETEQEAVAYIAQYATPPSPAADEISPGPWVVERGSIAWMIREGPGGPQIGNFILEADARYVVRLRNAPVADSASEEDR